MSKGSHLGDGYATTLARMRAQKGSRSRLGIEALMWVSNSERPLNTSELCHALGVKIGSVDLDLENVPEMRTILGCSLGLITVEAYTSTVRLVHLTLQEYLSGNPSLFQSPHSMIAEVCLMYLNFRCVRELPPTLTSAPSRVPLVEYASHYWGKHIVRERTESVTLLAFRLLVEFEKHISSQLLWLHDYEDQYWGEEAFEEGSPKRFTGLHMAASLGIVDIVAPLLVMKEWNINAGDIMGQTALTVAVGRGHEAVVELLLKREDINPNIADSIDGRAPLWLAAEDGHEGIVKLLLGRDDINPNTKDTYYGRTPLMRAAGTGHEAIVKLLLDQEDINPNTPNTRYNQTPLWLAANVGYEGIVKLLLERDDINPNTEDTYYDQTPLMRAADAGNEATVKLLLGREDINPTLQTLDIIEHHSGSPRSAGMRE